MRKTIREYSGIILIVCISVFFIYYLNSKIFDISIFDAKNEYSAIKELTSEKYQGRLAGTKGNQLALSYVENYFKEIGLKPGGDNGTYYQNFKSMVPMHLSKPQMRILDKSGREIKNYKIGKDYREVIDGYGGNGKVKTELFYLKNWIRDYSKQQLNGKVIVVDTLIGDNDIDYAIDCGVVAVIAPVVNNIAKLPMDTKSKTGKSLMISLMEQQAYNEMLTYAEKECQIEMKLDEQFKYVNTPNLLGVLQGTDKNAGYIVIAAHIDGFGSEYDSDIYYPGAVYGASGTGVVKELARVFASQKHRLNKTVVFALWNNESYGKKGKQFYIENPIYPLGNSTVIYIDSVGSKDSIDYKINYTGQSSQILRDKIAQFTKHVLKQNDPYMMQDFSKAGATAISFTDNLLGISSLGYISEYTAIGTPEDAINNISLKRLDEVGTLLLTYTKREVAGDVFGNVFTNSELLLLGVIALAAFIIFVMSTLNRLKPNLKMNGISIEDIYYSTPYELFDKFVKMFCQACIVLILLVFVTHLPGNINLFQINGQIHTNFSWNQVISDTVNYFRMLYNIGFGFTTNNMEVWEYISYSFIRSFGLLFAVLVVGLAFGIAKGIFDAFRDENNKLRTIGTIIVFSLPDVFVVLSLQILLIYLYSHNIISIPREYMEQKLFVEAFLCLIILPAIYITRIASVAVHEEKKKGYVKAAKAKGLSNFSIIRKHLLISILIKVTEALPSLLSLMISNLIIVEYLSSYNGIVTNMMIAFRQGEVNAYTGLAISLCVLYVAFVALFKLAGKLLNPLKRREL